MVGHVLGPGRGSLGSVECKLLIVEDLCEIDIVLHYGIYVEFVALIVRNRIYTKLKEELNSIEENPNYMTVPAALRELEKIEMIRGRDRIYRLYHAVTKTQKTILNAFGMDASYVKKRAERISEQLKIADNIGR